MVGEVEVNIYLGDVRKSGGQSLWAKELTKIDVTKTNGYAFEGRFLRKATGKVGGPKYNKIEDIVPEGSFVVATVSTGSWNHPGTDIVLYRAESGELKEVYRNAWKPHKKAQIIRDIAEIMGQRDEKAEIMQVIRQLVEKYGIDKVREAVEECLKQDNM